MGDDWWIHIIDYLAKPFSPWKGNYPYEWCVSKEMAGSRVHTELGLMYIKSPKTASSTATGVTLQIAKNVAQRQNVKMCLAHATHSFATKDGASYRKQPSLLWTTVRHPAKRMISEFYHFWVCRRGIEPTSDNVIDYIIYGKRNHRSPNKRVDYSYEGKNRQLMYLTTATEFGPNAMVGWDTVERATNMIKSTVMDQYNFIAVTERMDESLVAMKLLFGLEHQDIIVLSAKSSGTRDEKTCRIIPKPLPDPKVDHYLTTTFIEDNYDYLLYAAADRSLDLTIEALGKDLFQRELALHRRLQKLAEEQCLPVAVFPCTEDGEKNGIQSKKSCLWADAGCGYQCVQQVVNSMPESMQ